MIDIMKTVKSLEESGLLIKGVSKPIKNEAIEQKGRFLSMLLRTLGASLLGNLLTVKGIITAREGSLKAGEETTGRPWFLMPPYPLKFLKIQKYFWKNLPQIKDRA